MTRTVVRISSAFALAALLAFPVHAQKAYGPGVSDTEIKLGQSTPLSGPASAFGAGAGRAVVGYFDMLNEQGGIGGRKISFTQLDNAYSAPKAIEQSRKLVEDIGVLAEVGTIGTVPNVAIQKYLNSKQVPQLFITAGGGNLWVSGGRSNSQGNYVGSIAPTGNVTVWSGGAPYTHSYGRKLAKITPQNYRRHQP